jgi:SAM-dependent methyltransferase
MDRADTAVLQRRIGIEFRKSYQKRLQDGFLEKYLSGTKILDVGFRGGDTEAVPITEAAIGVELDYPGYDGVTLPFEDMSQDAVLASHVLEHIIDYRTILADWYRVLKIGGYMLIFVPHKYIYERRCDLPSRWNGDHKRFYTTSSLLAEVEESLPINGFRIRHLAENDTNFNYSLPATARPAGCYEIELVLEKIARPQYSARLEYAPHLRVMIERLNAVVFEMIASNAVSGDVHISDLIGAFGYFPAWARILEWFLGPSADVYPKKFISESALRTAVRPLLKFVSVDEEYYARRYPELDAALRNGTIKNLSDHWRNHGYFEGRLHRMELNDKI